MSKYKTDDLWVASYIMAEGNDFTSVEHEGFHAYVVFNDDSDGKLRKLQKQYYRGDVKVSIPCLRDSLKEIKDQIRYTKTGEDKNERYGTIRRR